MGSPEESLVFFDGTAERTAPQPVKEILPGNSLSIGEEVIRSPLRRALLDVPVPVELVGSGFHRGVEHASACSTHFRVVGVDLDSDFLDRVNIRNKDRAVPQVRDRYAVEQVVVASNWTATQGEKRRVGLILHPNIEGITRVNHVGNRQSHHEGVSTGIG